MKKKLFAILISFAMMFAMISAMSITAFAAETFENGLYVKQTTDKIDYKSQEQITTTLTVTNTNKHQSNVTSVVLTNLAPKGYAVKSEGTDTKKVPVIRAGESISLETTFVAKKPIAAMAEDSTNWVLIIGGAVLAGIGIAAFVRHRKGQKNIVPVLILCLAIGGCGFMPSVSEAATGKMPEGDIPLVTTVKINNKDVSVYSVVDYGYRAAERYTVKFDMQEHGEEIATQTVTASTKARKPEDPTAPGYIFEGWFKEAECTNEWDFDDDIVKSDITLYAKWTEGDDVIITYQSSDTEKGSVSRVSESVAPATGTPLGSTAIPTTGYHLAKWTNSLGITVSTNQSFVPARVEEVNVSDIYTAHFAANTYKVTFDAYESSGIRVTIDETYNSTYVLPRQYPDKEYYTFAGWFTDPEGGTEVTEDTIVKITKPQTLYPHWIPMEYKVRFVANEGQWADGDTTKYVMQLYGEKYTVPTSNPVREGYDFAGWWTGRTDGEQLTSGTKVSGGSPYYAHWTPKKTTITVNKTGGTGGNDTVTATYDEDMPDVGATPTKEGYTFTGYYDAETEGTQYYDQDGASVKTWDKEEETATIYAQWKENEPTPPVE